MAEDDLGAASPADWARRHPLERLASRPTLVLLAFTVVYLVPTVVLASQKLLWDDEFYTLYLSTTSSWADLRTALATGADQHPPTYYYLIQRIIRLAGVSHVVLRSPSILGIWLLSVCLYFILRRLTTPSWAVVGMLTPLVTGAYWYSAEARGYGLMMGFLALALFAWLRTADEGWRGLYLILLGGGFAGAACCHYYALPALGPIVLGELTRTVKRRRLDWPVWLAFASVLIPLAICLPALRDASKYSLHFWAIPRWSGTFEYYPRMLSMLVDVSLFCVLGITSLGIRRASGWRSAFVLRPMRVWEKVALSSFAVLPPVIMVVAKTVTHAYVERYALPALLGALILVCYFLAYFARGTPSRATWATAFLLVWFAIMVSILLQGNSGLRNTFRDDLQVLSNSGTDPVVLAEITVFHTLSFYGPRSTARRFSYLADLDFALRYMGHNSVDRGFLDLRPWFPLNVAPFRDFIARTPKFLVYGYSGPWSWVTHRFVLPDYKSVLVRRVRSRMLLFVDNSKFASGDARALSSEVPSLYDRMHVAEPTLCEHYMGIGRCPSFE